MPKVTVSSLEIEGAPLEGENPLPFFRNENHAINVGVRDGFPERYKKLLGSACAFRLLPYTRQDRYTRSRKKIALKTVILENEVLRAEFLCDYGGRLWSLYNKKENRELLYRNPVFQLSNLAIRNAWFSGGIEWNIGQYGHAFSTCSPVFFAALKDSDGNEFLRMYDYERCKGFFWHIDFHLPPQSELLFTHVQVYNLHKKESSLYYWTNIAVPEIPSSRVFSASKNCIYMDPTAEKGSKRFGYGSLPELPVLPGVDATYPFKSKYSNEYFFTCDEVKMPWEVAAEKNGTAFFDVSTDRLKYRKMFCWGSLQGGRHWPQFLAQDNSYYFEIQGGLAPTQLHGIQMPASSVWNWTQAFGSLTDLDTEQTHGTDWNAACGYIRKEIGQKIDEVKLYELHSTFEAAARLEISDSPDSLLHTGTGWGALELERRRAAKEDLPPPVFRFAPQTLGAEQEPYLCLLRNKCFPEKDPQEVPWSFIVQDEWRLLLEQSVVTGMVAADTQNPAILWNTLLHLGVLYCERGENCKAAECWQRSLTIVENAWAYRNLAVLRRAESINDAFELYEKSMGVCGFYADRAIAEEYLTLLVENKRYQQAIEVYEHIHKKGATNVAFNPESSDKIAAMYGVALAFTGNYNEAFKVLERDFADVREGETPLTDIWYEALAGERAAREKIPLTTELREKVRADSVPPARIDFRMK